MRVGRFFKRRYVLICASMEKWKTPSPCLMLSVSNSILRTNFEYCEDKNHGIFKNIMIYKAKQFMSTKSLWSKSTFKKTMQVVCK